MSERDKYRYSDARTRSHLGRVLNQENPPKKEKPPGLLSRLTRKSLDAEFFKIYSNNKLPSGAKDVIQRHITSGKVTKKNGEYFDKDNKRLMYAQKSKSDKPRWQWGPRNWDK